MLRDIAFWTMLVSGFSLFILLIRISWDKYKSVKLENPELEREWVADCAKLTTATYKGSTVNLKNVRDFTWLSKREHDNKWSNLKVKLDDIVDIWYIVDHFHKIRGMAHTMITFEFKGGQFITFSFETRREVGERYNPWNGLWRAYELYLLVATESDALHLRTNIRGNKVHLFRVHSKGCIFLQLLFSFRMKK